MPEKEYKGSVPKQSGTAEATRRSLEDMLGLPMDQVSWQNLEEEYPVFAGALREVVGSGYLPQEIRQFVMQRHWPMEWANWFEQAARYLKAEANA